MPWHVALVETAIADEWGCPHSTVREQVWANFLSIVKDQLPSGEYVG